MLGAGFMASFVFHDTVLAGQMRVIVVHFKRGFFLVFGTFVRRKNLADGDTAEQLDFQRVYMGVNLVALSDVQS
jgi:hypothetical protein